MSILAQKFTLTGRQPIQGCSGSIYESFQTAEFVTAASVGSGAGQPDAQGTLQPGTIQPGHIVTQDANGNVVLATSPDLAAALSVMLWVVVSGNDDYGGMASKRVNCAHGGLRMKTEKFDPAQSYVVGAPLIAAAGILTPKVLSDNKQVFGYVASTYDAASGVLDAFAVQGASRY